MMNNVDEKEGVDGKHDIRHVEVKGTEMLKGQYCGLAQTINTSEHRTHTSLRIDNRKGLIKLMRIYTRPILFSRCRRGGKKTRIQLTRILLSADLLYLL